jgi:CysZ protein
MQKKFKAPAPASAEWIPLSHSLGLILRRKRLLGLSFLLVVVTILLTWLGYLITVDYVDELTGHFMTTAPATDTILGWIKHKGWLVGSWLFLVVSRIVAFYFAFLFAYSLSTPGYVFLSAAAEKLYAGELFDADANLTLSGFFIDIFEGIKIAIFGIVITIVALFVNFIPGIGQAAVFLLYTYYSALMFMDFPASRRRWSLKRKIGWLQTHSSPAFRIGVMPALVSMIPVINIFAIALLFPILTVHTTLNFTAIELAKKVPASPPQGDPDGKRN